MDRAHADSPSSISLPPCWVSRPSAFSVLFCVAQLVTEQIATDALAYAQGISTVCISPWCAAACWLWVEKHKQQVPYRAIRGHAIMQSCSHYMTCHVTKPCNHAKIVSPDESCQFLVHLYVAIGTTCVYIDHDIYTFHLVVSFAGLLWYGIA